MVASCCHLCCINLTRLTMLPVTIAEDWPVLEGLILLPATQSGTVHVCVQNNVCWSSELFQVSCETVLAS